MPSDLGEEHVTKRVRRRLASTRRLALTVQVTVEENGRRPIQLRRRVALRR